MVELREPHDYAIKDHDDFLLNYRYSLTNVLEAEQAIPWLIDNGVLDEGDQQKILNGHTTSVLKAGMYPW
jgi:hypothetical protein